IHNKIWEETHTIFQDISGNRVKLDKERQILLRVIQWKIIDYKPVNINIITNAESKIIEFSIGEIKDCMTINNQMLTDSKQMLIVFKILCNSILELENISKLSNLWQENKILGESIYKELDSISIQHKYILCECAFCPGKNIIDS
ncbi:MAG: hypothetical protein NTV30_03220, partial [Chloroflexi bacterium]|nr:hypothetical protein [Chloroflexota bacterium]